MDATKLAHQYFSDLASDGKADNDTDLDAWLWFTCPATMRAEVRCEIEKLRNAS